EIAARAGADVLLVLNASPFEQGKHHQRVELCQTRAADTGATVVYVAAVGGQDELVFDGGSMVVRPDGTVATSSPRFATDLLVCEFDVSTPGDAVGSEPARDRATAKQAAIAEEPGDLAEVYEALVIGLRDYVNKNRMRSVVLGLSGGIDSALVAAIACDAIGANNVYGIAMPSKYSSHHSVDDAHDTATRTGLSIRQVPIAPVFDAYQGLLSLSGLAEENLQARIRGTTLMAVSNAEGHLVLATGNKSEIAVGYSTIYGDAVGGFAPIKDVPKTLVWALSQWRNEIAHARGEVPPIPPNSITKPPSAELRPDQLDSDSLPDYEKLDAIVAQYVEGGVSASDLIADGFDPELSRKIIRLTDAAEYKRRQYPPGTKITRLAFGRDRRMPITNRWSEPGEVGE
ncbi:MAG: NAD+ synthase, partial [Candidatus Nanopelagicales bacterium]